MLKLNTYIQYFEIKLILSINVSSLSLFENFNGTTGRDGFPGKRQKLVPGQTFGKEREIAVTNNRGEKNVQVMICFGSSPLGSFNLAFSLKALIDMRYWRVRIGGKRQKQSEQHVQLWRARKFQNALECKKEFDPSLVPSVVVRRQMASFLLNSLH